MHNRDCRSTKEEVVGEFFHRLVLLQFYGVFDLIEIIGFLEGWSIIR